jgi:hypothetical protein
MQYQIPQFIDTEDKIVGPLTLRQFIYLSLAAGASMMLYFVVSNWLWFGLMAVIMGLGAAFALIKVNGRPFARVARSALMFYWEPQTYVWLPDQPSLPKNETTVREVTGGFSLEKIVAGMALKSAWTHVQTGSKESADAAKLHMSRLKEKYEIFQGIGGDRRAAKRIDYR